MKFEPPFSLPAIPREHTMMGVGGFMESQNFVSGTSGWKIDGAGAAEFTVGVDSGHFTAEGTVSTLKMYATGAAAFIQSSSPWSEVSGGLRIAGTSTYSQTQLSTMGMESGSTDKPEILMYHHTDGEASIDIKLADGSPRIYLHDTSGGTNVVQFLDSDYIYFGNSTSVAPVVTSYGLLRCYGSLIVNYDDADANLYFSNDGNTYINWDDSDGAWTFNNVGTARFSVWAAGAVLNTCSVGTGDSLEINAYGVIVKNTSSERYKNIDTTIDMTQHLSPEMVDNLHPKMWAFKNDTDQHPHISLISEEANEVSPFFVTKSFDDNGDVALSGLKDRAIMSLLIVALQDARTRIATLEA